RLADDISGETWLAIATRIPHFEGDERSFGSWVFVIARQRLADARHTGARRHTDPFADVAEHGQGPSTRDAGPSTEDLALDGLDAQGAVDLIARLLTADQAEVVLLRTLGGLSVADVAATLGRNEGWVRVTHHRAVQRLQDRLAARMVAWQREGVAGAR
ncbi:MAG: polymerase, sigma-24 subunit, subfamily, partial [Ilumatobacteraceae bacterium]|nr:polymerase, sigma-24 subunit, subfamily [Ilumatobacteraceae bacterium]